ncbi:MAG: glycosyltransferase family 4 protein [Deltaproteobacteria bacterium]|nr:glycosyltransferase family 4 protein [Deltaproteobacteria bacterium]
MTKILHIIQCLASGGGPRALIAAAKYSARFGDYEHRVASLLPVDSNGLHLAEEAGMTVTVPRDRSALFHEIEKADIVHMSWWNNPEIYELLRSDFPAMRLIIWFHTSGDIAPQIITPELVDFADFALPCSPYTYQCRAIQNLTPDERLKKTGMVYGAADFARLKGIEPKPHDTFNVGYLGLATPYKIHPNFIPMSASIDIPDVKFIVCGFIDEVFPQQAQRLGVAERFDFRGYVNDIKSVLETFDVFGYPLGIRVAAELVMQEAMYAGVPPVVFPAGGIKELVINDYTGIIVHSELEYKHAIEYLYYHPEERKRLGNNAKEYARQIFGAENAAKKLNAIYERMMQRQKRKRLWKDRRSVNLLNQTVTLSDLTNKKKDDHEVSGAEIFIETLGDSGEAKALNTSMNSEDITELFRVEREISSYPPIMYCNDTGGILQYEGYYPTDPYLRLWAGLMWNQRSDHDIAVSEFQSAINVGFKHWRVYWYLAQAAEKAGNLILAKKSLNTVLQSAPEFTEAHEMNYRIVEVEIVPEVEPERFSTACPHCNEILYVDRKGRWQCPCCKNDFVV